MKEVRTVHYSKDITEIGVIADTHIPSRGRFLPPEIFSIFDGVQLILHAGDLVDEMIIEELRTIAPVEAVAGNMDSDLLHRRLGKLKLIKIGDVAIGLLHGDVVGRRVSFDRVVELFMPEKLQALVFGHLHEPLCKVHEGILYLNPGSPIDPRRTPRPSCGRMTINGSEIKGQIIYL